MYFKCKLSSKERQYCCLFQTIEVKKNIELKAKVKGDPNPDVTWYFNETEITPTFKNKITHTGEECTLVISGATTKMTGVYKIVAYNTFGHCEYSAQINVTEKMEPPKFTVKPMNKEVKEGEPIKLVAKAKGSPKPELEVYKNDQQIQPDDRTKIETKDVNGEVQVTFTMESLTPEDAAAYNFIAKNAAGQDSCHAVVKVTCKYN